MLAFVMYTSSPHMIPPVALPKLPAARPRRDGNLVQNAHLLKIRVRRRQKRQGVVKDIFPVK